MSNPVNPNRRPAPNLPPPLFPKGPRGTRVFNATGPHARPATRYNVDFAAKVLPQPTAPDPANRTRPIHSIIDGRQMDWARAPTNSITPVGGVDLPSDQVMTAGFSKFNYYHGLFGQLCEEDGYPGISPIHRISRSNFTILRGDHQSGKTTLICAIAIAAARIARKNDCDYGEFSTQTGPSVADRDPQRPSQTDAYFVGMRGAILSPKFIIVAHTSHSAGSLKRYFNELYHHMQVDVYFSVGGSQPEDQFHTDDQGDVNYKYDAMFANRPIHGLIVDGYTAIEMIKRDSYIGTVFIENCENFDSMGYLTPLLSVAASKMDTPDMTLRAPVEKGERLFSIGRVVLITSSTNTDDWLFHQVDKLTGGPYSMTVHQHTLVTRVHGQMFAFSAFPAGDVVMNSGQFKALNGDISYLDSATMKRAKEKLWQDMSFKRTDTDVALVNRERVFPPGCRNPHESDIPDTNTARIEMGCAIYSAFKDVVEEVQVDDESSDPDKRIKYIPTIVAVVPSRELVSFFGNSLKHCDTSNIQAADHRMAGRIVGTHERIPPVEGQLDYDSAFIVHKLFAGWKYDPDATRIKKGTPYVDITVCRSEALGDNHVRKGRIIITIPEIAVTLEIDNLATIVLSNCLYVNGGYRAHGLSESRAQFVDRPLILQLASRFNRGRNNPPRRRFLFAGSKYQAAVSMTMDNQEERHDRCYRLNDYMLEHCAPDRRALFHPRNEHELKRTVVGAGLGVQSGNGEELKTETAFLSSILPHVDPRLVRLVVLGLKMGVASHAIGLAANEMTMGRLSQQAAATEHQAGLNTYKNPVVDVFKAAVRILPLGNQYSHGIPDIGHYPSEEIAMADYYSSFIRPSGWTPMSYTYTYRQFTGPQFPNLGGQEDTSLIWTQSDANSFWTASWTTGQGFDNNDTFDEIRLAARATGRPADFPLLYQMMIKDEGRDAFHQALKEINKALIATGLIRDHGETTSFMEPQYNRYLIDDSDLLNMDGRRLLSGILVMCHSNVSVFKRPKDDGKHVIEGRHVIKRVGPNGVMLELPRAPLYWTYDRNSDNVENGRGQLFELDVGLSGFSNAQLPNTRSTQFAMYTGTNNVGKTGIYHVLPHACAAGHLLLLGNIHSDYITTRVDDDGSKSIGLEFTGLPNSGTVMWFNLINLTDDPSYVEETRATMRTALNSAIRGLPMDDYEKATIHIWRLFE